ncbi:MAG: MBL fold metallo-hydrolase [Deltaproteobacteria bacterium]|nr:MBL fold metallo-hydrolase [Deltaproteobacteria bacterium]
MKAQILNLYSNDTKPNSRLKGDHGQSFLITIGEEQVLFDTGASGKILLHNMALLGIDPGAVSKLVFSHGHYDHTRGLPHLLDNRNDSVALPVFAHSAVREKKIAKTGFFVKSLGFPDLNRIQETKLNFHLTDKPQQIAPALKTTGEIVQRAEKEGIEPNIFHHADGQWRVDPVKDDISLVLNTIDGTVIIVGCAHAGILNICEQVKQLNAGTPIKAIIGGTHMVRHTPEEVSHVATQLQMKYDSPHLYLNHCTDKLPVPFVRKTKTIQILKKIYDAQKVRDCRVGTSFEFSLAP